MKMTLPTTRIDTLQLEEGSRSNDLEETQQLLVDFIPNGESQGQSQDSRGASKSKNRPSIDSSHFSSYPANFHQPVSSNSNHKHPVPTSSDFVDLDNFTPISLNTLEDVNTFYERKRRSSRNSSFENKLDFRFTNGPGPDAAIPLQLTSLSRGAGDLEAASATMNVKLSSSLSSSSDDSDTEFLVQHNGVKDRALLGKGQQHQYRLQNSNPASTGYPGSPGFNSVQQSHRKRLRRRRSSGRRKPRSMPDQNEPGDLISICCCFGDDEQDNLNISNDGRVNSGSGSSSSSSSLTSKYLRYSCIIVMIIVIATFASIMVSLQRKIDSLSWEVKKYSAAGSLEFTKSDHDNPNQSPSATVNLTGNLELLNSTFISLKSSVEELNLRVINLEKQSKGLPPSIEEVRKDLATLGSELQGSIQEMKKNFDNLQNSVNAAEEKKTGGGGGVGNGGAETTPSSQPS